ncbi:MAG: DUF488 domain-containing protein [Anaerolineae bacterium]
MTISLYTIGSSGWTAEQFFTALQTAGVRRVLDIRQGGSTLLSGFAIKRDLRYFLRAIAGIDYVALPQLAPSAEAFRAYRKRELSHDEYMQAYGRQLEESGALHRLEHGLLDGGCLLCSEHDPAHCHRHIAADMLADLWPEMRVQHLTLTPPRLHLV